MPTNLTATPSWDTVIPRPNDGEGATAAGLGALAQPILNRTEFNHSVIHSSGVPRIRTFADITAMKTSTPAGTGDVGYVLGLGIYRYDSTGVGPDDQPWTVEHDTGGLWTHENADMRGVNFPTLSGGKVPTAQIPNALLAVASNTVDGVGNMFISNASTWTDATGGSTSVTGVTASDKLLVSLSCRAILGAAPLSAGTCKLRLAYELLAPGGTPTRSTTSRRSHRSSSSKRRPT